MAMPSSNIGMIDAANVDDDTSAKSVLLGKAQQFRDAAKRNREILAKLRQEVEQIITDAEKCERLAQDLEAAAGKLA